MTMNESNQYIVLDSWENALNDEQQLKNPIINKTDKMPMDKVPMDKVPMNNVPMDKVPMDKVSNIQKNQKNLEMTSLSEFPNLSKTNQRIKTANITEHKSKRSEAFEKLSNKESLIKNLYKTSLCKSIFNDIKCPHGQNCRFAHSINELRTSHCLFGSDCRFIKNCSDNSYTNVTANKKCTHIHPNETRINFLTRIGVDITKVPQEVPTEVCQEVPKEVPKEVPEEVPEEVPKEVPEEVPEEVPIESNYITSYPISKSNKKIHPIKKLVNSVREQTYTDEELTEVLIKVPLALSQQAIDLALKSGKPNVRIEIV